MNTACDTHTHTRARARKSRSVTGNAVLYRRTCALPCGYRYALLTWKIFMYVSSVSSTLALHSTVTANTCRSHTSAATDALYGLYSIVSATEMDRPPCSMSHVNLHVHLKVCLFRACERVCVLVLVCACVSACVRVCVGAQHAH